MRKGDGKVGFNYNEHEENIKSIDYERTEAYGSKCLIRKALDISQQEIIKGIRMLPYFVSFSPCNDWNKVCSIDKIKLINLLSEFEWSYHLEDSYIDDDIYICVINFTDLNFKTDIPEMFDEQAQDYLYILGIYIVKDAFDRILEVMKKDLEVMKKDFK